MPNPPLSRCGEPIKSKGREVAFSLWPISEDSTRKSIQPRIFATNPWTIMRASVEKRCIKSFKNAAQAFLIQAEDYYKAASMAEIVAAKPVLFYYSFLNLAKAYVLTENYNILGSEALHGLAERNVTGSKIIHGAYLKAHQTSPKNINVFDQLYIAINEKGLDKNIKEYRIMHLLPQILQGHRLWCQASERHNERFVEIDDIQLMCNDKNKTAWINISIFDDDLSRYYISHKELLIKSGLNDSFKEVRNDSAGENKRKLLIFQLQQEIAYRQRPIDSIAELVKKIRNKIWSNVLSTPPYRKYYLYLSPKNGKEFLLPQLLSIYAIFFYFGSVTRYRPHIFNNALKNDYGSQIQEIITNVPNQFLYLMASQYAKQEITRASIV